MSNNQKVTKAASLIYNASIISRKNLKNIANILNIDFNIELTKKELDDIVKRIKDINVIDNSILDWNYSIIKKIKVLTKDDINKIYKGIENINIINSSIINRYKDDKISLNSSKLSKLYNELTHLNTSFDILNYLKDLYNKDFKTITLPQIVKGLSNITPISKDLINQLVKTDLSTDLIKLIKDSNTIDSSLIKDFMKSLKIGNVTYSQILKDILNIDITDDIIKNISKSIKGNNIKLSTLLDLIKTKEDLSIIKNIARKLNIEYGSINSNQISSLLSKINSVDDLKIIKNFAKKLGISNLSISSLLKNIISKDTNIENIVKSIKNVISKNGGVNYSSLKQLIENVDDVNIVKNIVNSFIISNIKLPDLFGTIKSLKLSSSVKKDLDKIIQGQVNYKNIYNYVKSYNNNIGNFVRYVKNINNNYKNIKSILDVNIKSLNTYLKQIKYGINDYVKSYNELISQISSLKLFQKIKYDIENKLKNKTTFYINLNNYIKDNILLPGTLSETEYLSKFNEVIKDNNIINKLKKQSVKGYGVNIVLYLVNEIKINNNKLFVIYVNYKREDLSFIYNYKSKKINGNSKLINNNLKKQIEHISKK